MKIIEVDEELYHYIASQTRSIGESASDILRRLLNLPALAVSPLDSEFTSSEKDQEKTILTEKEIANKPASAVKNSDHLLNETSQKSEKSSEKGVDEKVAKPVKKQSETAINQIVEKVQALLNSTSFQEESKAVVRFLAILRVLYRTNPESFAQATESLQGRTRVYFARDEATLLLSGNHTKPKQIPDTPYWVITNTNSGRKMLMLEGAMQSMHLPEALIEEVRSYFTVN